MAKLNQLVLTLCLCFAGTALFAAPTPVGNVVQTNVYLSSAEFKLSGGGIARVDLLSESIARVRVNATGQLSTRVSPAISAEVFSAPINSVVDLGAVVWLVTNEMKIAVGKSPFRVIALHADSSLMSADLESGVLFDSVTKQIINRKYSPPDEAIFGLGMRGGPINRRGRTIVMRNTDNSGYGELTDPLYQSYPMYYGVRDGHAYGVFVDSPEYPFFDVANSETGVLTFGAAQGELNYYLIAGPKPENVAHNYSRLTGFNPLPPLWSLGYHHSRYGWHSDQEIRGIAEQLRNQDFPTESLWFDVDYMDNFSKFTWDPVECPNPVLLHSDLKQEGFKSVYINEPCVRDDDPLWPFLDASNYFLKNADNESHLNTIWFGNVSWIDYSKTATASWYKNQLKTFLSTGIDGLWNDLNEPANNFMPDARYDFDGEGRSETEARNLYALLVNKVAYEAQLEQFPNKRPWNFSRGGYSGIQRYAHTWGGDAPSTFDSLRVAIQMSTSMGLSGQNQFGHDIGGFLGSPNAELFTRWMEFSLFTPLFRNHSTNTALPREPWVYGEPHTSRIRGLIKWRYRMLPYVYTLFEEASRTGRPVLMPTFFYAESDTNTFSQDTEYLFGANLLVAPVFTEGSTSREVYLPDNSDWIDFHSKEFYPGGQFVTVDAPLGQPPLLVRNGAIIPQSANQTYLNDPQKSADMLADIFPNGESQFTLFEDEGNGFEYQNGRYLRTRISASQESAALNVALDRQDGDYLPPQRTWAVYVHRQAAKPSQVFLNGALISERAAQQVSEGDSAESWYYEAATNVLILNTSDTGNINFNAQFE